MKMQRREFLRAGLLAAGGLTAGTVGADRLLSAGAKSSGPRAAATLALTPDGELVVTPSAEYAALAQTSDEVRRGVPGRRWIMVIDLAACDGCGQCALACAKNHFIPTDREYLRIFKMQDSPDLAPYWFPRPCFHCDNPPCTRVCPVGATFKREDGIVLIDNERCIGCRFCMAACPYSVRVFNWGRPNDPPEAHARGYSPEWGYPRRVGTVEKCDFCADMTREGKLPHCAGRCPMGAIWFGDENDDAVTNSAGKTVRLSKLLRDRAGFRYMEELGTKPRVFYLPAVNRQYPAPNEPGANHGNLPRGGETQSAQ
jgi:molybdopterin-containing oxidoreductase family iron-sulfur binding subunit